jgi:hypothetical protein
MVLWRLAGEPGMDNALPSDVSTGDWFAGGVQYVLDKGMMSVDASGLFRPNAIATTEDVRWDVLRVLKEPTDLTWGSRAVLIGQTESLMTYPGAGYWMIADSRAATYTVRVYRVVSGGVNEEIYQIDQPCGGRDEQKYGSFELYEEDYKVGETYFFTVQAKMDGVPDLSSDIMKSEKWTYRAPSAKFDNPTNLSLNNGVVSWSGTDSDFLEWFYLRVYWQDDETDEPEKILSETVAGKSSNVQYHLSQFGSGYYTFEVKACSRDITAVQNSGWTSRKVYISGPPRAATGADGVYVQAQVDSGTGEKTAYCAVYDARGKMLGISELPLTGKNTVFVACDPSQAVTVKIFTLDGSSAPVTEATEVGV